MRVLVVWYDYFHYLSGITDALNSIPDVQAEKFVLQYFIKQAQWDEKLLSKVGVTCFEENYNKRIQNELIERCTIYRPDLILFLNADYRHIINDDFFAFVKSKKIKTAVWFVDSLRNMKGYDGDYLSKFDQIYSFDRSDIDYAHRVYKINGVKFLPLGLDIVAYSCHNTDKKYDICFVGAADKKRLEILEIVANYCVQKNKKMIVYGQMWKHRPIWTSIKHKCKFKKQYPNLYRFVVNKYLEANDVATIYSQSKICLNIIREQSNGANPRTFEILGTKSLQLVDYGKDIADLFEHGKHLIMYSDNKDIVSLIEYYLHNDGERESIAWYGYELVKEKYTLDKLVTTIIQDMRGRGQV